jgi:hypothetical protein
MVISVQRFGFHAQPTLVVLRFNQALAPAPAENPSNYHVFNFKSRPVTVGTAAYNTQTHTVVLVLRRPLNLFHAVPLLVNGTSPNGLTSATGVFLDGANTGQPGSDFSALIDRRILAGTATTGASAATDAATGAVP